MFPKQPYYFGLLPQFLDRDQPQDEPFAVQSLAIPGQPIREALPASATERQEIFQVFQLLDMDFDLVIAPAGKFPDLPSAKFWRQLFLLQPFHHAADEFQQFAARSGQFTERLPKQVGGQFVGNGDVVQRGFDVVPGVGVVLDGPLQLIQERDG